MVDFEALSSVSSDYERICFNEANLTLGYSQLLALTKYKVKLLALHFYLQLSATLYL